MKKYELTGETKVFTGVTVHRIRALVDIPKHGIKAGDLGGFIEKENNLSHDKECWIGDNACVFGDAVVLGNALIYGDAGVLGNALIYGDARVFGYAWICDRACVCGNAWIYGDARVCGNARIIQGKYHVSTIHIAMQPYSITAIYPNHVQIGCHLFEICDKKKAIETMKRFNVSQKQHEHIWLAVKLCKQWLEDNPEKEITNV